jgi:hypothetical protein
MDEVLNLLERIYEDGVVKPDELMNALKKNFQLLSDVCVPLKKRQDTRRDPKRS